MFILTILFLIFLPFALLWQLKLRVNFWEITVLVLMLLLLSSITNLPDFDNYELSYKLLLDRGEPGFLAIESFFSSLNFNFFQFYMVCHVACLMAVYLSIKMMSLDATKCLLVYTFFPFVLDVIQIRNALFMALALLAFAICTRCKNRIVECVVWISFILLASTIHYSAYAYLPAVFFWNKKTPNLKFPIVMFFLTIFLILIDGSSLMLLMQRIFSFLDTFDTKYDGYMEKRTSLGGFLMMLKSILMICIVWLAQKINIQFLVDDDNRSVARIPYEKIIGNTYGFLIYSSVFWPFYVISATFGRLMQNQLLLVYVVFFFLFRYGTLYNDSTEKKLKEDFLFKITLLFIALIFIHSEWVWIDLWDYVIVCLVDNLKLLYVFYAS